MDESNPISLLSSSLNESYMKKEDKELANILNELSINFIYGCPILLKDNEQKTILRADFLLPHYLTVIDFFEDKYSHKYFKNTKAGLFFTNDFIYIPILREKFIKDNAKIQVFNLIKVGWIKRIKNLSSKLNSIE